MLAQRDVLVWGLRQSARTPEEFAFEAAHGSRTQCAAMDSFGTRICLETKPVQLADEFTANRNTARVIKRQVQIFIISKALHEKGRAAVNEALSQFRMKRVGQFVLDRPSDRLPVGTVLCPVRPVRRICPGSYLRQPSTQGRDIAFSLIEAGDLPSEPVIR